MTPQDYTAELSRAYRKWCADELTSAAYMRIVAGLRSRFLLEHDAEGWGGVVRDSKRAVTR